MHSFPRHLSTSVPVHGDNVVATSQPLAAQAGLRTLLDGGNAVDAAIAAAMALTVVEPTSNGIGSDLFAMVWDGERLHGLNASGRSPARLTAERFAGMASMPHRGWDTVTVPGAVSGWVELSKRFGSVPLTRLAQPAISYADGGFLVSPLVAAAWSRAAQELSGFEGFAAGFLPSGKPPKAGDRFAFPDQAVTLRAIAESDGAEFYGGSIARAMVADAERHGGLLSATDLRQHRADWVQPVSVSYHGVDVHELPPNGQGMATLIALGILEHRAGGTPPLDSADSVHLQIEAMKLAFADLYRYCADPAHMEIDLASFLRPDYLASRAELIDMEHAGDPAFGAPRQAGTVYLTAADEHGMMVSLIQSNYDGFGSGIVVPGTGVSLQNRGAGFTLEPGHPNVVAGGKRPMHTIIPGFMTRGGRPLMSFGVMGGVMQAQGHVQMTLRTVDGEADPQSAIDAPRWRVVEGRKVAVEARFPADVVRELELRGHDVTVMPDEVLTTFGGAQAIRRLDSGYVAGSDRRKDGHAAVC